MNSVARALPVLAIVIGGLADTTLATMPAHIAPGPAAMAPSSPPAGITPSVGVAPSSPPANGGAQTPQGGPAPGGAAQPSLPIISLRVPPTGYGLVGKSAPNVHMGGSFRIRLLDGTPPFDCERLQLRLNVGGTMIGQLTPKCEAGADNEFTLYLQRTPDNTNNWTTFLNAFHTRWNGGKADVLVAYDGKSLAPPRASEVEAYHKGLPVLISNGNVVARISNQEVKDFDANQPLPAGVTKEVVEQYRAQQARFADISASTQIDYESVDTPRILIACVVLTALLGGSWYLTRGTAALRDGQIPQMLIKDRSFSLGFSQMAIWLVVIVASYLYIYLFTLDINAITPQCYTLMGISALTAMGSIIVKSNQPEFHNDIKTKLDELGLKSLDDTLLIYKDKQTGNDEIRLKKILGCTDAAPKAEDLENMVKDLKAKYESAILPAKTRSWLLDCVTDGDGATLHRWQMLIWTLVIACIYCVTVITTYSMPPLDQSILGLMGISGGIYVGFKTQEAPGNPLPQKPGS